MSASPSSEGPIGAACLLGEWARLLFGTLESAGVTDLWVSPGSRSTPFTWAAAHCGITVRSVVDERSAGFLALGSARITGRPNALLCTSGSALANYFPAIVEASLSHLPLLVLTADRPLDVQHAGASQTMDQLKLFGDYVRAFYDLGLPEAAPEALLGARRAVAQAVAQTVGPLPGPVHLNLRARKPLEPAAPRSEAERALARSVSELLARPILRFAPHASLANEAVRAAARTIQDAGSGAIVVGPLPAFGSSLAEPIAELARLTGFPIFAEAGSQVRFELADHPLSFPHFDWLLTAKGASERFRPELLLYIGQTPTSSALERWAAGVPRQIVLGRYGYPDAQCRAEIVASGDLDVALPALLSELSSFSAPRDVAPAVRELGALRSLCDRAIAQALAAPWEPLSEGGAVKAIVESLPSGAVLALGNSLPIRDVDAYVEHAARVRVTTQRGVSGIDGLVSGAIGSAVASRAPTLLLIGDVSLLHDLGALASARLVETPLVLAVIDNAGGRIFDQLPVQALYANDHEAARLWLTPPSLDLSHAAALFDVHYRAPTTPAAVGEETAAALARDGVTLLHLRVAPHSAADMRRHVRDALEADLRAARPGSKG